MLKESTTKPPTYHKLLIFLIIVASGLVSLWLFTKPSATKELPLTSTSTPAALVSTTTPTKTISQETKIYRSEEFGFEFQYPKEWELEENSFRSSFSKFNLEGDSSAKDYNPENPALLVNVVTPDFAERQFASFKSVAQKITVGGVDGKKYEYTEQFSEIGIILPLGQYKVILGTRKEYESIFNEIVASFKFLK